jgi:hypothetical protein
MPKKLVRRLNTRLKNCLALNLWRSVRNCYPVSCNWKADALLKGEKKSSCDPVYWIWYFSESTCRNLSEIESDFGSPVGTLGKP